MHGEYKMPGGKLIVADLDVDDGKLANVHISGDFFLQPDTALEVINAALGGQSATLGQRQLADAIAHALAPDTQMFGISPVAVAVAVRRALGTVP